MLTNSVRFVDKATEVENVVTAWQILAKFLHKKVILLLDYFRLDQEVKCQANNYGKPLWEFT